MTKTEKLMGWIGSEPAFPRPADERHYGSEGMTLRQWYAGLAMQGILAHGRNCTDELVARAAFAMADAMLEHEARKATHEDR